MAGLKIEDGKTVREIIFRGKRVDNGEWISGDLRHWRNGTVGIHNDALRCTMVVNPETVGQYTGLKDKNGRRIFEGDVLAIKFFPAYIERVCWKGEPDAIASVIWDLNAFRLYADGKLDKRYGDFCDINYRETEIIGNIYDNPELLERKKI